MNAKKTITAILLLFVVTAIVTVAIKGIKSETPEVSSVTTGVSSTGSMNAVATIPSGLPVAANADVDVVYYFMTSQRCQNCMNIEAYTKEAVEQHYKEMLSNNKMLWKMVNVDDPQYRNFIQDYQLYTKSVVLVRYRDGKQVEWKNLDQIWDLLGDKVAFQDYIVKEVNSFVQES